MKRALLPGLVLCALALFPSCEAFQQIIHETVPPPDQLSPQGTVKLFAIAADSNDVDVALSYLCTRGGKQLAALERFEYGDELQRYLNRVHGRYLRVWEAKGSRVEGDTLVTVNAEFDWLFFWHFKTRRIGEKWYISEIQEEIQ